MHSNQTSHDAEKGPLRRILRWSNQCVLFCATIGVVLLCLGMLALPLAGWGAAYVFAVGLWILAAAGLPLCVLLITAIVFRLKHGAWYFGTSQD